MRFVAAGEVSAVISYCDDESSSSMSDGGEHVSQRGLWVWIGAFVLGTAGALSLWLHDHAALQGTLTQPHGGERPLQGRPRFDASDSSVASKALPIPWSCHFG